MRDIANVWKNLREVDLRPIREEALRPVRLAIVGRPGVGRHTLAEQLRTDPQRPTSRTQTAVTIAEPDPADGLAAAELLIIMIDAASNDLSREQALAQAWVDAGRQVLVLVNKADLVGDQQPIANEVAWPTGRVVHGSALDSAFLQRELVPMVLELLPARSLSLSRQFPLFRMTVARQLINETSLSNAGYALSTGVAEVIPILHIPLNLADMVVLTKAQAFLVYKLGLVLGFSTRWQDYVREFGSVVGGGFLWRQAARMLVGLIPGWGIVPKVAVAFAGTNVVGNVVLQWYLTGRHISKKQMRTLYQQALTSGQQTARDLITRLPRLRPRRSQVAQVNVKTRVRRPLLRLPRLSLRRRRAVQLPAPDDNPCPFCGKSNAPDALFCQYCGLTFRPTGTMKGG
jgi:uncharacterized protein (DUF697 family)